MIRVPRRGEVVERTDWLLLFLSRDSLGVDGPAEVDPIRIQKGMFLLSQRGPARDLYAFRPYNWGPFSPAIYGDLDYLVGEGLVEIEAVPGQTWKRYRTTQKGESKTSKLIDRVDASAVDWLGRARRYVTSRSFSQLLREIYARYPKYATESLLR